MKSALAFSLRLGTTNLGRLVLAWFVATLIADHPTWIAWLGDTMEKDITDACWWIHRYAIAGVLLFAKDHAETGGTKPTTTEAKERLQ